jgi:ABC-type Fe3+-siderophore transport system permease subunit
MNKYIVKATAQVVGGFALVMATSIGCSMALQYYEATAQQVLAIVGIGLFSYILYKLVRIQADVLESTERLNNK